MIKSYFSLTFHSEYCTGRGSKAGSQTRGPRGRLVRPAMLFGNFEMFNIYVAKCLEKRCREINEPKLNYTRCGFHLGHSTTDQNFTLQQIFEKSWKYAKHFYTYFVNLEKAYDWVPRDKLWGVLREYGVDCRLLLAVKSLYTCSEVCVRVGRVKSQPFTGGVGFRQRCMLSLLFSSKSTSAVAKLRPADRPV